VRVKICGARRPKDVAACLEAGADHVGFNFVARSRRRVTPAQARALAADLPAGVGVGVFEDAEPAFILAICAEAGLLVAQVHGPLSLQGAAEIAQRLRLIRALPGADRDCPALSAWAPHVTAFLFDGPRPGSGTPWATERALGPTRAGRPTFLAGGLRPRTVAAAVARFQPGGLDVASGVEGPDGHIDPARVRAFTQAARAAASSTPA